MVMVKKTIKKKIMAKSMKKTSEKTKKIINDSPKTVNKTNETKEITKKNETVDNKKEEKTDRGFLYILGSITLLLLVFAFLFVDITQEKSLEEKCLSYQNDPALQFPCKCVPTIREKNESDIVEVKTDELCTCYCEIGNNETAAIEIRVAK